MSQWGSEDTRNVYAGLNSKGQQDRAGWLKPVATAAGAAGGFLLGGPAGAMAGAQMGGAAGGLGHDVVNGQLTPESALGDVASGYSGFQGIDRAAQAKALIEAFMANPHQFRLGFATGGLVPPPSQMDQLLQMLQNRAGSPTGANMGVQPNSAPQGVLGASSDVLGAIPSQVQSLLGPEPSVPTPQPLQQAQHPTLEAISALLPQIMAAMPRPANPKNNKAIGAWLPAAGLAMSAPAAVAQSRRASANAPIQAGNDARRTQYEADKKAYEAQRGTLTNTLAGNATKPFAEQNVNRMDQLAPATTLAGLKAPAWVHTWGDLKEWQQSVTNDRLARSAATAGAGATSQQDLPGDAEIAADEIASFRGEPKIPTSNRYPGYSGLVTSLANQKLKANGSPYTVQQLQTLWKEKQNWLTTNNAQRFTLLRQAAVTVRKHIQQMKAFYKTYGNLARPSGINTVGKSQFDLALEGFLGADARAAAEQLALNQDFVTGEAALVMSAGFAPHKEVVDRMAKRLQVATKGKSAGLATINALESLVGARVQSALESTPFAGGKKNPYLIDVSPIEGWNEAGVSEEQPKKKSGWMPKGAVEVKGN